MPTIYGNDTPDTLVGTEVNDHIHGWNSLNPPNGEGPVQDNDLLIGLGGNDKLEGGGGDDQVEGGEGHDELYGNDGNDTVIGGAGDDDIAEYQFYSDDTGSDLIYAGLGNDRIYQVYGVDTVFAGDGNDIVDFDNLSGLVEGGAGDDRVHFDIVNYGATIGEVQLNGGGGFDKLMLYLVRLPDAVAFDFSLTSVDQNGLSVTGFEQVEIYSGIFDDTLTGGARNDRLHAGGGDNLVYGGLGSDQIDGDFGENIFYGGDGQDVLSVDFGASSLFGGEGGDSLQGSADRDVLSGEQGRDDLSGGRDRDQLFGAEDDDQLFGGTGNDTFQGGAGDDTLWGQQGHDSFDFVGDPSRRDLDVIADFNPDMDRIRLSAADFDVLPLRNLRDHAFALGTTALDRTDRILYDPETGEVRYDADGLGGQEAILFLIVTSNEPLTADDFKVI